MIRSMTRTALAHLAGIALALLVYGCGQCFGAIITPIPANPPPLERVLLYNKQTYDLDMTWTGSAWRSDAPFVTWAVPTGTGYALYQGQIGGGVFNIGTELYGTGQIQNFKADPAMYYPLVVPEPSLTLCLVALLLLLRGFSFPRRKLR